MLRSIEEEWSRVRRWALVLPLFPARAPAGCGPPFRPALVRSTSFVCGASVLYWRPSIVLYEHRVVRSHSHCSRHFSNFPLRDECKRARSEKGSENSKIVCDWDNQRTAQRMQLRTSHGKGSLPATEAERGEETQTTRRVQAQSAGTPT
jgi:hypothetical protein